MKLFDKTFPQLIDFPKFYDDRGNLTFVQNEDQIPFQIKRSYWIFDVPGGECRGGHAYKNTEEVIIALSGAFDIILDDGKNKRVYSLNHSYYGLYIPKGFWREMNNFSTNSLALVFASTDFDEADYIREYEQFNSLKDNGLL